MQLYPIHATTPWPPESSWSYHPNGILCGIQSIKLLVMYSSPLPCYLVPHRPKYTPQHPILENPLPSFHPHCERPSWFWVWRRRNGEKVERRWIYDRDNAVRKGNGFVHRLCRAVRYLYTCNNVRKTHREKQVWLLQSYGSYLRSLSSVCVYFVSDCNSLNHHLLQLVELQLLATHCCWSVWAQVRHLAFFTQQFKKSRLRCGSNVKRSVRKTQGSSHNHCCSGKPISSKY